jgi:hypothetical protein
MIPRVSIFFEKFFVCIYRYALLYKQSISISEWILKFIRYFLYAKSTLTYKFVASLSLSAEVLSEMYRGVRTKKTHLIFFTLFFLIILPGCSYRMRIAKPPQTPIFIAMPINDNAPEPISQLLYEALVSTFLQQGYDVVARPQQGYVFKTIVQYLTPTQHFISQDVVLLHKLVEFKAICSLYNFRKELVLEKTFTFETIVSKALAPLQQDAYTVQSLCGMLERNIQTIEQTFRQHLQ